jgi:hypothetical protein
LSETFFPYFFHVHLNILDKVVSNLYAIFGTPCICRLRKASINVWPRSKYLGRHIGKSGNIQGDQKENKSEQVLQIIGHAVAEF